MSKKTVVSDYIKNKFENIKKDSFLEEISKLPFVNQKELLIEEMENINEYIKIIKSNNNYYDTIDNKKVLNKNIKKYIDDLKKIINKYSEYYKCLNLLEYYDSRQERIDQKINFESSQIVLTNNQISIFNQLNENNIDNFKFNDLVSIAKYLIQNFNEEKLNIIKLILNKLEEIFINNNYSDEYFVAISSIKNMLTYKINYLDKNDSDRKVLKELKKYVRSIISFSKEKESNMHDYRVDIINVFLDSELYMNKIIQKNSEWINILDDDGNSLAYNVLVKYLDLYLLELQGKQSSILKEKYLNIYFMINESPHYLYKDVDKFKIDSLFDNFKETIKNGDFKRSTYLDVIKNLDGILIKNEKDDLQKKFDNKIISFENERILENKCDDQRVDLTNEYTIIITSNNSDLYNYAYSINKNENDNYILKVHITDMAKFIEPNSYLDEMLKNSMFKTNKYWLENKLLSKFSLVKGEKKPALTLECEILPDRQIKNLRCFESNIVVDDIYSFEEFNKNIKKEENLLYLQAGQILNNNLDITNCGKSLEYSFNKCILDEVGKYFEKNNYPYIYKVQPIQSSDNYIKLLTKLNYLFAKIDKEDANMFYNIICDDTNYSKYSLKPQYHSQLDQKYYTDLLIPLHSYIGLYLQYLIKTFMLNKNNLDKNIVKNIYKTDLKNIISLANVKKEEKRVNKQKKKINSN